MNRVPVVVVFALRRESLFFRRRCRHFQRLPAPCPAWSCRFGQLPIELVETGMGATAMEEALAWRFQAEFPRPDRLLLAGFCGALHSNLGPGALVPIGEIVDVQGQHYITAEETGRRLLTFPVLVGTTAAKTRLREQFQADAVDMESVVAARWCQQHGVAFSCLRAVSDDAETNLSLALQGLLTSGRVSALKLTAALLRRPTLVFELLHLARNTRLAAQHLAAGTEMWIRRGEVRENAEQRRIPP